MAAVEVTSKRILCLVNETIIAKQNEIKKKIVDSRCGNEKFYFVFGYCESKIKEAEDKIKKKKIKHVKFKGYYPDLQEHVFQQLKLVNPKIKIVT